MARDRYFITFPQQCGNNPNTYKRVINDYWKLITDDSAREIVFECGDVRFIRPFGVNVLALLIRSFLQQEGRTIFFVQPTSQRCNKYLEDQGFYKEFHIQDSDRTIEASTRSTSVGLRRMVKFEPLYFDTIAIWLNRFLALPEESIKDAVNIPLSEIILNVVDHSKSSLGCYISAQAYPKEDRLVFSVADLGVGFLDTLRPHYPDLRTNEAAIALAVQSGISSKSRGSNVGAGLSILCGFLKQRGNLEIISLDGVWHQDTAGNSLSRTISFRFPGSCINIEFDNQKIADLMWQEDDDEIGR